MNWDTITAAVARARDKTKWPSWWKADVTARLRYRLSAPLRCPWCNGHMTLFALPVRTTGGVDMHPGCADRAELFALKARIRHRTNPARLHLGWRP